MCVHLKYIYICIYIFPLCLLLALPWVTQTRCISSFKDGRRQILHQTHFLFVFLINCKTLLARTKHNKMHDTDSLPFSDWRKYDTVFITPSSLQQTSTLISVTLPHSLTSSQGQSEDQFLLKSPAPPLASAPAGILGSWPLPPPPGRCWYDCGSERLLVGQLEWIKKWTTVTFRGHQIITCVATLNPRMLLV